jgi:PRTRC genetic system protein B
MSETVSGSHLRGLFPQVALIMYSKRMAYGQEENYVEIADFVRTSDGYRMLPGKPITKTGAEQIAKSLSTCSAASLRPMEGTLIPSNVLSFSGGSSPMVLWVVKEQTLACSFHENLNIPVSSVRYPNILFQVKNSELFVYAVKAEVPSLTEELYSLPLPNIHQNYRVCLGDADVNEPSEYLQNFMKQFEDAFFGSEFNTYHGAERGYAGINVNEFWKRMGQAMTFDYSVLRPITIRKKPLTVKDLLK